MRQWRILRRRTSQPKQASLLAPIEVAEQTPNETLRLFHVKGVENSSRCMHMSTKPNSRDQCAEPAPAPAVFLQGFRACGREAVALRSPPPPLRSPIVGGWHGWSTLMLLLIRFAHTKKAASSETAFSWYLPLQAGAGDGNRTHVTSLEGWGSTIELHPHVER